MQPVVGLIARRIALSGDPVAPRQVIGHGRLKFRTMLFRAVPLHLPSRSWLHPPIVAWHRRTLAVRVIPSQRGSSPSSRRRADMNRPESGEPHETDCHGLRERTNVPQPVRFRPCRVEGVRRTSSEALKTRVTPPTVGQVDERISADDDTRNATGTRQESGRRRQRRRSRCAQPVPRRQLRIALTAATCARVPNPGVTPTSGAPRQTWVARSCHRTAVPPREPGRQQLRC